MANGRAWDASLQELASRQFGLITRREAIQHGISENALSARLKSGAWMKLHPGVYRYGGAPPSRHQAILAACLAHGPRAVAASFTAAELWGLREVYKRDAIHVAVPWEVKTRLRDVDCSRRRHLSRGEHVSTVHGIPVTSVARTFVDVCGPIPESALERSVIEATRLGQLLPEDLEHAVATADQERALKTLRGLAGLRGLPKLRSILARKSFLDAYRSASEAAVAQRLRAAGYTDLILNEDLWHAGIRLGEPDIRIERIHLIVEVDGYGHDADEQQRIDSIRTEAYRARGYAVVRGTPKELKDPSILLARIAEETARPRQFLHGDAFRTLWELLCRAYGITPSQVRPPSRQSRRVEIAPEVPLRAGPP